MSITNKVTVGLVSIAFVFSLGVVNSAIAADDDDITKLQAQIAQLLEQIQGLQSTQGGSSSRTASGTYTTSSSGSSAACPYTWTRNLSIGSTGDDVRQLQRFLNGNPQTQVAVSGAGSPGNESSYYGPATARAVSKFQEMYAAHILTPLGLTKGTGGLYTSTRKQLNSVCQSGDRGVSVNRQGPRSATAPAVVRVTGDALAVTPGNPISDSYVVKGAQRAPFTSVVLTAGTDDVRIESIRIKRFGLSSSDNFDSVALVDANGVQVGSARSINSRDEVSLGSNFIVPSNRSVTLAVVGNMVTDDDDFSSGAIAGLEIAEVIADATVQGRFPIRGAAHVFSDSIDLQSVVVEVSGGGGAIDFNEDTEVASVTIDLRSSDADEEDAYLRSIVLEQVGSADEREMGKIEVYVDNDRVDHTLAINRDRYIINFSGKGVLIEEGDSAEVSLEINTDRGSEETVEFKIDDIADIYVLGASYGYGLPVTIKGDTDGNNKKDANETWRDMTSVATISSGKIDSGGRLKKFEDEIRYGDDIILGALSVDFEGEDVEMEDLTFKVELGYSSLWTDADTNAWEDAEEDTIRFDSVRLRVDGENVAYANDSVDFDEPSKADDFDFVSETDDERVTVEFDSNFILDVRDDREVIFEIVADLDAAWSHFDGTSVEFTLVDVGKAEGVNSEEDHTDIAKSGYFASDREFKKVKIAGNELAFEINDDGMDGENFVRGSDNVVFGTLEIDASNAIDDVELRDLWISFQIPAQAVGDLSHLNDCRILDESGDEVADGRGVSGSRDTSGSRALPDQARFRFDDFIVEADDKVDVDIVCDIDDKADASDKYRIVVNDDADVQDRVVYRIGRKEDEYPLTDGDASSLVTVDESGELEVATRNPDEDEPVIAIAVGDTGADNIAVLEIELEADKEDAEIVDVYLGLPTVFGADNTQISEDVLDTVFDRFTLKLGNTVADSDDYIATKTFAAADYDNQSGTVTGLRLIEFESINETVEDGDDNMEKFNLTVDFNGIDKNDGSAGQFLATDVPSKLYIVWEGEDSGTTNLTEHTIVAGDLTAALPFPSVPTVSTTAKSPSLKVGKQKIYEFTVHADDEGDVYLDQVGFGIGLSGNATIDGLKIYRGTDNDGAVRGAKTGSISTGDHKVTFNHVEEIEKGRSYIYSVYANVTAAADNSAVTVEMLHDEKESAPKTGRESSAARAVGNFIWSPNSLNKDGAQSSNADWFIGWTVVTDSDTHQWSLEKD